MFLPLCLLTGRTIHWDSRNSWNCTYFLFFSMSGVQNMKKKCLWEWLTSFYSLLAHIYLDFSSFLSGAVFMHFPPPCNQQYFIAARPFLIVRLVLLSAVTSLQHLANVHSKVERESWAHAYPQMERCVYVVVVMVGGKPFLGRHKRCVWIFWVCQFIQHHFNKRALGHSAR